MSGFPGSRSELVYMRIANQFTSQERSVPGGFTIRLYTGLQVEAKTGLQITVQTGLQFCRWELIMAAAMACWLSMVMVR